MNKPLPKTRTMMDFHEMIHFVEKKYKIDVRDYAGKFKETKSVSDDKPYLDYWHWMIENHFYEVNNGCDMYWNILGILGKNEDYEEGPDWVKEITQLVYDEFKDNLDSDGGLMVHIEW